MNITNDEVLAVLILKERRIVNLELQLQLAIADNENLKAKIAELEKPETTPSAIEAALKARLDATIKVVEQVIDDLPRSVATDLRKAMGES